MEHTVDQGVRNNHLSGYPAEDKSSQVNNDRVPVHKRGRWADGEYHEGDGEPQAKYEQEQIPVRRTGDSENVISAHHQVGDHDRDHGLSECFGLALEFILRRSLDKEFDSDPRDERTAQKLHQTDGQ